MNQIHLFHPLYNSTKQDNALNEWSLKNEGSTKDTVNNSCSVAFWRKRGACFVVEVVQSK